VTGLAVIQQRWYAEIMLAMEEGPKRFNHLLSTIKRVECYGTKQVVVHISDRVLSDRLRALEGAGLAKREVKVEVGKAVMVSYQLTPAAEPYMAPLHALARLA
jgi:DNA-binding HxlR family transcriptional regulator